ncbi:hypothetical protein ACFL1X_11055 [Candidatus Hydrogenedentota bacterium]
MPEQDTHGGAVRLGDLLVAKALVTRAQLEEAIILQQSTMSNKRLGEVLLRMGYVTSRSLSDNLAELLNIPTINLQEADIPQSIIDSVRPDVAQIYRIVPVRIGEGFIEVATDEPNNLEKLDLLEKIFEGQVIPLVATKEDINEKLRLCYGAQSTSVKTMLSSISTASSMSTLSSMGTISGASALTGSSLGSMSSGSISSLSGASSLSGVDIDVVPTEKSRKAN